jgi:hypothetical protein
MLLPKGMNLLLKLDHVFFSILFAPIFHLPLISLATTGILVLLSTEWTVHVCFNPLFLANRAHAMKTWQDGFLGPTHANGAFIILCIFLSFTVIR